MSWLIGLVTLPVLACIAAGIILTLRPGLNPGRARAWFKGALAANLLLPLAGFAGLLAFGIGEALAQPAQSAGETGAMGISVGMGIALLAVGLPTAASTIGAAIALGPIGSASLAVLAERPETFGRTLIYMGLAEGIAIYGLVISILILDRL